MPLTIRKIQNKNVLVSILSTLNVLSYIKDIE